MLSSNVTRGVIGFLIFVALATVGLLIRWPPSSSSDAAAWAQAAAAAAAIVTALFVVVLQHQLQMERDAKEDRLAHRKRMEVAHLLGEYTLQIADRCIRLCGPGQSPDVDTLETAVGQLHAIGNAFEKYRAEDFPYYEDLEVLINTISLRNAVENRVADACRRGRSHPIGDHLRLGLEELVRLLGPIVRRLGELRTAERA